MARFKGWACFPNVYETVIDRKTRLRKLQAIIFIFIKMNEIGDEKKRKFGTDSNVLWQSVVLDMDLQM